MIDVAIYNPDVKENGMVDALHRGTVVTGIRLIAQQFLIVLLTMKNSARYNCQQHHSGLVTGTEFITAVRGGLLRTTADISNAFHAAEMDCRLQLQSINRDEGLTEADEQYQSARLLNIVHEPLRVLLFIRVHSTRSKLTLIVPIPKN